MKNVITNQFVTGGYAVPDYFCDRTEELKRLLEAISSWRAGICLKTCSSLPTVRFIRALSSCILTGYLKKTTMHSLKTSSTSLIGVKKVRLEYDVFFSRWLQYHYRE